MKSKLKENTVIHVMCFLTLCGCESTFPVAYCQFCSVRFSCSLKKIKDWYSGIGGGKGKYWTKQYKNHRITEWLRFKGTS